MSSLRRRTLLIVAALMLATVVVVVAVQQWLVYPSFLHLEHEQAQRNAQRVLQLMNRELTLLAPSVEDWGYWDDSHDYAANRNEEYVSANLGVGSQTNLKVNLLAYYDTGGAKIWSRGMDFASAMVFPLDEFAHARLPPGYPLLSQEDEPRLRYGLLNTSRGPMLAASVPILRSDGSGPRRGTLIMGRFLDEENVQLLAQQAQLHIELRQTRRTNASAVATSGPGLQLPYSGFDTEALPDVIRSHTTLFNVSGRPLLDLVIDTPRDISRRGYRALEASVLSIAIVGFFITALLAWMLNRSVLRPIVQITRHTQRVTGQEERAERLDLRREDEIGELADEFDRMLLRLKETRQRLYNESYRAGANEMAGGVLQDLQRSLEPLKVHIDQPLKLLDRTHISGLHMLLQELHGQDVSHHRQKEIAQLLTQEINEQADLLAEARGELRGIRKSLEQLQGIVTEYSRYLGSSGARETLALAELVEHGLRRLGGELRQRLNAEVEDSVYRAAPVQAVRELLQRVISVLIERIAMAAPAEAGLRLNLRISAHGEFRDGRSLVCLLFDDDRASLSADALAAIFDPSPASEQGGGTDLAWAESAVTSMEGRLIAEHAPAMQGLQLRLLLPRAKPGEH